MIDFETAHNLARKIIDVNIYSFAKGLKRFKKINSKGYKMRIPISIKF